MQTEKNVCIELKKWFNRYNIDCWLNFGENKFTTKLSQKKPDMIIYSQKQHQYIAIEVKPGNSSKDIHDASKIIEYWEEYNQNKIIYFIEEQEIIISSFCIATINSIFGKLFDNDNEICVGNLYFEPLFEYRRSRDYLRGLWSSWRKKRTRTEQPGIGIILSNILNKCEEQPLMFDMQWEHQIKPKWQNRQKIL